MFERAARMKLRFSYKGSVSCEDLWELEVQELDSIFKSLRAQQKQTEEESLLTTKNTKNDVLSLKIAIVKHIVEVKLAEKNKKEEAALRKKKKQELMALIVEKENQAIGAKPIEELKKMLEELDTDE